MQSVMTNQKHFSQVPEAEIQRSSFDRSHGLKTTFDAGYLVPIYVDEVLPGDTFNLNLTAFARLATPLKPIMDNLFMDIFFFAVPIRLIWDNWEKFNGSQENPDDPVDYLVPQFTADTVHARTLSDYMGLPVMISPKTVTFNSLHHRAYNLIWNQWFRDENLQDSVVVNKDDGPDEIADYVLLRRGKRHDYFTSCLPWPQKGDAVNIPIGGLTAVPVITDATEHFTGLQPSMKMRMSDTGGQPPLGHAAVINPTNLDGGLDIASTPIAGGAANRGIFPTNLIVDFGANVGTINSLRQAFQLQKMYERDARGGTRYIEILKSHFGVTSPDARLQRAEYLGGGSCPININPVAQTSVSAATPQGNLAAFGTVTHTGAGFTKSFVEHCVLLGLVSVRADLTYQQGLERMWSRRTRFDFFWPALAMLGEQAVLEQEIMYMDDPAWDADVFGYQERYAEYRYKPSKITGLFRSNLNAGQTTIDFWHLSQDFATPPLLSNTFIQEDPPIGRVIAVPTEPHFLYDSYIKLICARPMPVYGVPGLVDHF